MYLMNRKVANISCFDSDVQHHYLLYEMRIPDYEYEMITNGSMGNG